MADRFSMYNALKKGRKLPTLFEVLQLITSNDEVPLWVNERGEIDCIPQSDFKVTLRFMSEEETAETINLSSPLLIPWYDCKVANIGPDEHKRNSIEIWLMYEEHIKKHFASRVLWAEAGEGQEDDEC